MADMLGRLHMSATALDVVDRAVAGGSHTLVDGQGVFTYFTPLRDLAVTKLAFCSTGTASVAPTLARFGLFTAAANDDLTLVARTASDTSIFTVGSTVYERALDAAGGFVASYPLLRGVRYAVGVLLVGGTPGAIRMSTSFTAVSALAPRVSGTKGSLADLGNVAGLGNSTSVPWARLSA